MKVRGQDGRLSKHGVAEDGLPHELGPLVSGYPSTSVSVLSLCCPCHLSLSLSLPSRLYITQYLYFIVFIVLVDVCFILISVSPVVCR